MIPVTILVKSTGCIFMSSFDGQFFKALLPGSKSPSSPAEIQTHLVFLYLNMCCKLQIGNF